MGTRPSKRSRKEGKWASSHAVIDDSLKAPNESEPVGFCEEYRWKCQCRDAGKAWKAGHKRHKERGNHHEQVSG